MVSHITSTGTEMGITWLIFINLKGVVRHLTEVTNHPNSFITHIGIEIEFAVGTTKFSLISNKFFTTSFANHFRALPKTVESIRICL